MDSEDGFIGDLKVRKFTSFLSDLQIVKYQTANTQKPRTQKQRANELISYCDYITPSVYEEVAHFRVIVECSVMKTGRAIEAHGVVDNLLIFLNEIYCNFPVSFGCTKENGSDFTES